MKNTMKKMAGCALLLVLLAAFCLPFSAAALVPERDVVVVGAWEKIRYDGVSFVRIPTPAPEILGKGATNLTPYFKDQSVVYESEETERYASVGAVSLSDDLIRIDYTTALDRSGTIWFAREERAEEITAFSKEGKADSFRIEMWGEANFVTLDPREIASIRKDAAYVKNTLSAYADSMPVYACLNDGLYREWGAVYNVWDDDGRQEYYLVCYDDYGDEYFAMPAERADFIGLRKDGFEVGAWRIDDVALCEKLDMLYNQRWQPDDIFPFFPGEMSLGTAFSFGLVLFGILPIAIIVTAVIVLIRTRRRGSYLAFSLKGVIASQTLVILAFIAFSILLK